MVDAEGALFPAREFFVKVLNDLISGVEINLQFLAEGAKGRKAVAGAHLARDNSRGGVDHLLMDRDAGLEGKAIMRVLYHVVHYAGQLGRCLLGPPNLNYDSCG